MPYAIHKGLDKTVEFLGLGGQYLMLFLGGFVGILLITLILSAVAGALATLLFAAMSLMSLWFYVTYMNGKYGRYGVMQGQARRGCPRFLISRKKAINML
jgi:membrane protein implicated in regulation of membrane protease activity